jgi:sigma-E factor negative regulatory protein RseA
MSDIKNETLSVLMDGELDEISLRRVLNQMDDEPELKEIWSRFHLQRDVIKGDVSEFSTLDISGAIHDVIKDEDALKSDVQPSKTWWKTVAGLSVAASVTFAVVLGARFNPLLESQGSEQFAGKTQVQIVVPDITRVKTATMIAQSTNDLNTIDEESLQQAQKRLNTYLKQHAQDSALGQGRSAMPFARVVNFETPARQVKGN